MSDALVLRDGGTVTKRNNILTSSKKILEVIILQPYHLVKDQKSQQCVLSKKAHNAVYHSAAERGNKKEPAIFLWHQLYFIKLFLYMVLFLSSWLWCLVTILCRLLNMLSCPRYKHLLESWPIFSSMTFFPLVSIDENITSLCTEACVMFAGVCRMQVKEHLSAGWNVLL